jgi:hypothetical protein
VFVVLEETEDDFEEIGFKYIGIFVVKLKIEESTT